MNKNATQATENVVIPYRDVDFCLKWLAETYQTSFQIYGWSRCWICIDETQEPWSANQFAAVNLAVDQIGPQPRYASIDLEDKESIVVLPIESETDQPRMAIGILPTKCVGNLKNLINLLLEQIDLSRLNSQQYLLLEQYAEQASLDSEELAWFRTLVENLAFRDEATNLTNHALDALLRLKMLIRAETLILVLKTDEESTPTSEHAIHPIGERTLRGSEISRLMELAGANAYCETFIDHQVRGIDRTRSEGARSVVIVPAICSRRCFGWLIALSPIHGTDADRYTLADEMLGVRFDNRTALLMESAASVLAMHAHNQRLFDEQQETLLGTVRSLVNTIDTKDRYTWGHSDRVAQIARALAEEYGLSESECEKIYLAGLLHDIGKIGVRDEILSKPGRLTAEEYDEIKAHPEYGYQILKHLSQLQHVLPGVLHHHESWDGTGYPNRLAEFEIPLAARILAVADAYDAMTSDRPYRKGMSSQKAREILQHGSGQQWDSDVVDAFFRILKRVDEIERQEANPLKIRKASQEPEQSRLNEFSNLETLRSAILSTTAPHERAASHSDETSIDDTAIYSAEDIQKEIEAAKKQAVR